MKNVILELTRIQKEVLEIDSPLEQVHKIVDSISEVIGTDVCTLYLADENRDMVLIASHGLRSNGPVKIPAGQGLVGLVSSSRHVINLAVASQHPDFYYVPETEEERFKSFCGVPLVRYGDIIGVLVVQRAEPKALSPEDEAFLVTLSSQLALMVFDIPLPHNLGAPSNIRIMGARGSAGIGIGKVLYYDHGELYDVPDAPVENLEQALLEWRQLLAEVKRDILAEQSSLGSGLTDSIASIFNSYHALLSDHTFIDRVENEMKAGNWLPGALRRGIHHFSDLFSDMDDPYLQARQEDIHYLGNKLYYAWRGHKHQDLESLPEGQVILVGDQISVSDIASLAVDKIAGIVSFQGSSMSHTAVLANALGIPAVMGVGIIKQIRRGERLIVDGNTGQVIRYPSDMLCDEFQRLIDEDLQLQKQLVELRDKPAITRDGTEVKMFTNSGLLADLSPGLKHGAQGIGLYRTEIPFMVRESFPSEEEQIEVYRHVFAAYEDKPVYMRTLDIGGDKQLPYFPVTDEENPALGWRGIRFTLDNVQLLMTQVRAMIRAAGKREFNILLPMISSSTELDSFNQLLDEALEQLRKEGFAVIRPRVGVMLEVPAAISQIPYWAKRIDFISIGSNDLSQYVLALDRNNARVAKRYDHLHPAVIHEINRVVKKAKRSNIPVSLCGEMASDPLAAILLLGMGIRILSMSANRLPRIKWLIRALDIERAREMLDQALLLDNSEAIHKLLEKELKRITAGRIKLGSS